MYKMRPHHLLCLQKYTGHGYSSSFTSNMNSVVSTLRARPDTEVTLVQGCDDLCGACPNRIAAECQSDCERNDAVLATCNSALCTSEKKVRRIDDAVLAACDFSCGDSGSWSELAGKSRELILETETFDRICGDCQWVSLCRSTEKGLLCEETERKHVQNN